MTHTDCLTSSLCGDDNVGGAGNDPGTWHCPRMWVASESVLEVTECWSDLGPTLAAGLRRGCGLRVEEDGKLTRTPQR